MRLLDQIESNATFLAFMFMCLSAGFFDLVKTFIRENVSIVIASFIWIAVYELKVCIDHSQRERC
jgi:hypothetical protein